LVDTLARAFLPDFFRLLLDSASAADRMGAALASMSVYVFMALVLALRPAGLFPVSR
jgi:branched-chain amino acid transport system permease protein